MVTNAAVSPDYEQILSHIIRVLPPNRAEQLVDFARFLESQVLTEKLTQAETAAGIEDDNARWDALLATDEAQLLLEKLANEALVEHRAGKTKPMMINSSQLGKYQDKACCRNSSAPPLLPDHSS